MKQVKNVTTVGQPGSARGIGCGDVFEISLSTYFSISRRKSTYLTVTLR